MKYHFCYIIESCRQDLDSSWPHVVAIQRNDEEKGETLRYAYATQRRTSLATALLQSLPGVSPHKLQAKGSEVSFSRQ